MNEIHAYQEFLFHVIFTCVATLALVAGSYLLLRRHSTFSIAFKQLIGQTAKQWMDENM